MNLYQQYYEIRHQQDALAIEEAKLKGQIIDELNKVEIEKLIKEFSEPLVKQIDEFSTPLKKLVEDKKKDEIESGIAKEDTVISMTFSYLKK